MVSDRTDRPRSRCVEGGVEPGQGGLLLARRRAGSTPPPGADSSVAWAVAVPAALAATAPANAGLPGSRIVHGGRSGPAIAGRRRVTRWRVTASLSAPTGTCAKSWSRVTGSITGLPCEARQERSDTKARTGAHADGATRHHAARSRFAPGAPQVGHLVIDERRLGQEVGRPPAARRRPWPPATGPRPESDTMAVGPAALVDPGTGSRT